jgi:hypothetical protein
MGGLPHQKLAEGWIIWRSAVVNPMKEAAKAKSVKAIIDVLVK